MAEISATLVKELREKSGAGMMDCKKALNETSGNIEEAVDWLRKKGLAAAAKKAGRVAAEGLVGVVSSGTRGAVVEINAETDFVARNETFQQLVKTTASVVLSSGVTEVSTLIGQAFPGTTSTVEGEVTRLIAVIGENMNVRRAMHFEVSQGVVSSYIHNAVAPGLGKIGVLVAIESEGNPEALQELGKKIAMHIAASNPQALNISDVNQSDLDRERKVLTDQARASGRAEEIIAKMVEGRIRKYYEEIVLTEQIFVMDGQTKIANVVEEVAKTIAHPIQLIGFARFALGEGIEKEVSDFAAEVMAQAGCA